MVIPFLVDRLLSASDQTERKDDPEEDKLRNQSTLPAYPVSLCPILPSLVCQNSRTASSACVGQGMDVYLFMFKLFNSWEIQVNYLCISQRHSHRCCFSQGLFAEYIELLVQFGYLSLFSCVYPLTAMLLLINNLTEIRSDAYKICKLFRKPFSPPAANMGVWQVSRKHKERQKPLRSLKVDTSFSTVM